MDKLSSKLETTQKELSEERARRLAAEAELLLTRLCDVRSRSTGSIDTESTKLVCATHESADLVLRKDDQSSETETSVRDSTESWFDAPSSFCDQPVTWSSRNPLVSVAQSSPHVMTWHPNSTGDFRFLSYPSQRNLIKAAAAIIFYACIVQRHLFPLWGVQ